MATRTPELTSATASDLPDVLALLRDCGLLETGVAAAIEDFIVVRDGSELLGCAGFEVYGGQGLLRSVAVQASARKLGLGRKLVDAVVAAARGRGLSVGCPQTALPMRRTLGEVL